MIWYYVQSTVKRDYEKGEKKWVLKVIGSF